MNKIIVLQGPPAGGKSTLARELHKEDKNKVIICRDSIRESRGDYWIPNQEDWISDIEYHMVESALKNNLTPIIDATNLNPKTINKWENLAILYNTKCEYIECVVEYNEALKRDQERGNKVGKKVIKDFYKRYYPNLLYKSTPIDDIKKFEDGKPYAIICDLDGTLALRGNVDNPRTPFDYERVNEDYCDPRLSHLIKTLINDTEYKVFFVSGRENIGNCYEKTKQWLSNNIIEQCWYNFGIPQDNWALILRNENDKRPDDIVKKEIYETNIKPWYNVVAVFDDRNKVVDMWRKEGLLCCQVYEGDF